MGCGHSKINIYPRRARNKTNGKKSGATPEKTAESEEEAETLENDTGENNENPEDCESSGGKKTIKVKPFGGPLLAQTEISSSQQDFFKMLEDKIQNGPDYNSESETEKQAEAVRLTTLLRDWETASAGSRSLPNTPKRRPRAANTGDNKMAPRPPDRPSSHQIPQSVIHQSYGVTQAPQFRQPPTYIPGTNPPTYVITPTPLPSAYSSALQYQALSPMVYNPSPSNPTLPYQPKQYPSYNQHGSPIKTYVVAAPTTGPKFNVPPPVAAPYDYHHQGGAGATFGSPTHKLYGPPVVPKPVYANGELQHHQYYSQIQYQQVSQQQLPRRSYQSSVTIPIVVQHNNGQGVSEMSALHRKQYELT